MLILERRNIILKKLEANGIVRASEIALQCGASMETVRKDLFCLEQQGKLRRIHGGAISITENIPGFQARNAENNEYRKIAAHTACTLIKDNSFIALDSGTTTLEMAKILRFAELTLTILTNSVATYSYLCQNPKIRTILTGGEYNPLEEALWGPMAEKNIKSMHTDMAFICPSCISDKFGLTEYYSEAVQIQQAYLSISDSAVFVCDSSKFDKSALYKTIPIKKNMKIVTDSFLSESQKMRYEQAGAIFINNTSANI